MDSGDLQKALALSNDDLVYPGGGHPACLQCLSWLDFADVLYQSWAYECSRRWTEQREFGERLNFR